MNDQKTALPPHIEQAIDSIAQVHRAHHRDASMTERLTDATTANVGRLFFLVLVAAFVLVWIGASILLPRFGISFFDPFPFPLLDLLLSAAAIVIAVFILASQRRADRLGLLREQMTLEVALLTEHKSSKIIQLLEELRRDMPEVPDRMDKEAVEMADKPDHGTVLSAIDEAANKSPVNGREAT